MTLGQETRWPLSGTAHDNKLHKTAINKMTTATTLSDGSWVYYTESK